MKRVLPNLIPFHRTLVFQAVAGVVIAQAIGILVVTLLTQTALIYRIVPGAVTHQTTAINELVFLLESTPSDAAPIILSSFGGMSRAAVIREDHLARAPVPVVFTRAFEVSAETTGYSLLDRDMQFRILRFWQVVEGRRAGEVGSLLGVTGVELSIRLQSGEVVAVWMTPAAFFAQPNVLFVTLAWFLVAVSATLIIHIIFRPVRRLERAAERLGRTSRPEPVAEEGPEDIRRVARALNAMQDRVQGLLSERSEMLAALAHDIRTGLTRLRLRLDAVAEDSAALDDIAHIEMLVTDMMTYARAERPSHQAELIELRSFLIELVDGLPFEVGCELADTAYWIAADSAALRRAFSNLIENARLYGGAVHLVSRPVDEGLLVCIEDEGPGIPEDKLDTVFDAFYRLEGSRNRETGGTGLGLTISRALLSAQGAMLTLKNREGGGLSAQIIFYAGDEVA